MYRSVYAHISIIYTGKFGNHGVCSDGLWTTKKMMIAVNTA